MSNDGCGPDSRFVTHLKTVEGGGRRVNRGSSSDAKWGGARGEPCPKIWPWAEKSHLEGLVKLIHGDGMPMRGRLFPSWQQIFNFLKKNVEVIP
jgi:hypothetical protein